MIQEAKDLGRKVINEDPAKGAWVEEVEVFFADGNETRASLRNIG